MGKPESARDQAKRVYFARCDEVNRLAPQFEEEEVIDLLERAIMAAKAEAEAERDMLQDILDARPAINMGLPETYIAWSQAIYSGEATRAYIRKHGVN
jgi:hypothetical protein